jgi:hypothetical protein
VCIDGWGGCCFCCLGWGIYVCLSFFFDTVQYSISLAYDSSGGYDSSILLRRHDHESDLGLYSCFFVDFLDL